MPSFPLSAGSGSLHPLTPRSKRTLLVVAVAVPLAVAAFAVARRWNRQRSGAGDGSRLAADTANVQQSPGPAPRLVVRVFPLAGADVRSDGPVRLSNLESIKVEVTVSGSRFPLEPAELEANATSAQTLELSLRELPSRRAVPIRVWQSGTGSTERSQTARIGLEVPIDPAVARQRIQAAMVAAEKQEEARIAQGKGNPKLLARTRRKHDEIVSALVRDFFHENRTGLFELQAFYRGTEEGSWNGRVKSDPVAIEITNQGDYLQKHGFR